jgi:hypothetical protein
MCLVILILPTFISWSIRVRCTPKSKAASVMVSSCGEGIERLFREKGGIRPLDVQISRGSERITW